MTVTVDFKLTNMGFGGRGDDDDTIFVLPPLPGERSVGIMIKWPDMILQAEVRVRFEIEWPDS